MVNYKDKRWIAKRRVVLRRDDYKCRECTRYGKTKEANTVHHVKPAEFFPELFWPLTNLISLCTECHNKMHDRDTHELTAKGKEWVQRIFNE